jgi:hypothetical protein
MSTLAVSWIGYRKSQLLVERCDWLKLHLANPANVEKYGLRKALEMSQNSHDIRNFLTMTENTDQRKTLSKEDLDICGDEANLRSLRAAKFLFQYSLPMISNLDVLNSVGHVRNSLINKKTNKPLTDADILASDPHDLSNIGFNPSKEFQAKMTAMLGDLKNERTTITDKIESSKENDGYDLSQKLKDYIYEDGTLVEALKGHGISENFNGLSNSDRKSVSDGAFCLLSKYEPSLPATLIELGGESAVVAGYVLRALKDAKLMKDAGVLKDLWSAGKYGMTASGVITLASQIKKSCDPRRGSKNQKFTSAENQSTMVGFLRSDLDESIGYQTYSLAFDPKKIPSCDKDFDKSMMVDPHLPNCMLEILLMVAPLKIQIPAMLLTQ